MKKKKNNKQAQDPKIRFVFMQRKIDFFFCWKLIQITLVEHN